MCLLLNICYFSQACTLSPLIKLHHLHRPQWEDILFVEKYSRLLIFQQINLLFKRILEKREHRYLALNFVSWFCQKLTINISFIEVINTDNKNNATITIWFLRSPSMSWDRECVGGVVVILQSSRQSLSPDIDLEAGLGLVNNNKSDLLQDLVMFRLTS